MGPLRRAVPSQYCSKLGQSQECSLHAPHHSLAVSKSSISIQLGSAPSFSSPPHHHKHNSLPQTTQSNQPLASPKIYLYPPPPSNQSTWVPPPSPVNARAKSTAPAASFRRRAKSTALAASSRRRSTARDAWLCKSPTSPSSRHSQLHPAGSSCSYDSTEFSSLSQTICEHGTSLNFKGRQGLDLVLSPSVTDGAPMAHRQSQFFLYPTVCD